MLVGNLKELVIKIWVTDLDSQIYTLLGGLLGIREVCPTEFTYCYYKYWLFRFLYRRFVRLLA